MESPIHRSPGYRRKKFWWIRVKAGVKAQLRRFPRIATLLTRVWRAGRLPFVRGKWKLVTLVGTAKGTYLRELDVDKIYWVSPRRIVYSALRGFPLHDFKGHVIGGDWDLLEKKFEDLDIFIAFRQVCLEGKDWSETVFYNWTLDYLQAGYYRWGCRNKADLDRRCGYLESLFRTIRDEGYKSQREIALSEKNADPALAGTEVAVSIGRDGDLLFSDGAHRLAIAKLLDIPEIPVSIAVRHPMWVAFRKQLASHGARQPSTHPDLKDLVSSHHYEDRFQLIKKNISVEPGPLLDIGANFGYFCHRFEEQGFDCYAVEDGAEALYFLRKLKRAESRRFQIIAESVSEAREVRAVRFRVALALDIFHHLLKTKGIYEQLIDLLQNLQMDELFFEPHRVDEPQMRDAYRNYEPEEFVEFLLRNSRLTEAECIGTTLDQKPLYRLW